MRRVLVYLGALAALLLGPSCLAEVGAQFAPLEQRAADHPDDREMRLSLARAYEDSGFAEEAAAQYLALLSQDRTDADASVELDRLLADRMPAWLPPGAEAAAPFRCEVTTLAVPGPPATNWKLLATSSFDAHEGERADRLHEWRFPRVAYGYTWEEKTQRWQMRLRVHHQTATAPELVQGCLKTVLALYAVVRADTGLDPTAPWNQPLDLWLSAEGEPGAHSAGRSLYLYALGVPRAPEEWLRELAHEYGHTALPGIGGFTQTDDPWADGELAELLFVKWLAHTKTDWLPWSVGEAERAAAARRGKLISLIAAKPDPARLRGHDARARDYFLGLALKTEAESGPGRLAEVLSRCPGGTASEFLTALRARPR